MSSVIAYDAPAMPGIASDKLRHGLDLRLAQRPELVLVQVERQRVDVAEDRDAEIAVAEQRRVGRLARVRLCRRRRERRLVEQRLIWPVRAQADAAVSGPTLERADATLERADAAGAFRWVNRRTARTGATAAAAAVDCHRAAVAGRAAGRTPDLPRAGASRHRAESDDGAQRYLPARHGSTCSSGPKVTASPVTAMACAAIHCADRATVSTRSSSMRPS